MDFLTIIGRSIPEVVKEHYKKKLEYITEKNFEKNMGLILIFFLFLFVITTYLLIGIIGWVAVVLGFFSSLVVIEIVLDILGDSKAKNAEENLPEILQLIASNIRSGLPTELALLEAAKPQYGILAEKLKIASMKILAGMESKEALKELSKGIKSKLVGKTVDLLVESISSGGELSKVLISLANDVRMQKNMEEEAKASVSMYVMILFFALTIASPLLLATSNYVLTTIGKLSEKTDVTKIEQMATKVKSIGIIKPSVEPEFVKNFCVMVLFLNSLMGSAVIGIINSGSYKAGIKYFPVMLLLSLALFFGGSYALNSVFYSIAYKH